MSTTKARPIRYTKSLHLLLEKIPTDQERKKAVEGLTKIITMPKQTDGVRKKLMENAIRETKKQISKYFTQRGALRKGSNRNQGSRRNIKPKPKKKISKAQKLEITGQIDHLIRFAQDHEGGDAHKKVIDMFSKLIDKLGGEGHGHGHDKGLQTDDVESDSRIEEELVQSMQQPPNYLQQQVLREGTKRHDEEEEKSTQAFTKQTQTTTKQPNRAFSQMTEQQRMEEVPIISKRIQWGDIPAQQLKEAGFPSKTFAQKLFFMRSDKSMDTEEGETQQQYIKRLKSYLIDKPITEVERQKIKSKGSGEEDSEDALTDEEIDDIMRGNEYYIGTYTIDEIPDIVDKVKKLKLERFSFIVNTLPRKDFEKSDAVGHWIAVWCDTDMGDFLIYDCLGQNPKILIKELEQKFGDYFDKSQTHHLKFKFNSVQEQPFNSYLCGWYAIRAIHMLDQGLSWKTVTGFNNMAKNEKDVKGMEKKYEEFGYI